MDIKLLSTEQLEILGLGYSVAKEVFEVEPINASKKLKRKIVKWFYKTYIDNDFITECIIDFYEYSDNELLEVFKKCNELVAEKEHSDNARFENFCIDFNEDTIDAINCVFEQDFDVSSIKKDGSNLILQVYFGNSFNRFLILENAYGLPIGQNLDLQFHKESFAKNNDEYILAGEAFDYSCEDQDSVFPFAIKFKNAFVETKIYNAFSTRFDVDNPWEYLQSVSNEILRKSTLKVDFLNAKEKKLLPLISELSLLTIWYNIYNDRTNFEFEEFKKLLKKYNYKKPIAIIDKLAQNTVSRKTTSLINKLLYELNHQQYKPLWDYIYNKLSQAQEEYPYAAETKYPQILKEARKEIQSILHQNAYLGEYPDFYKTGSIKKIRLTESYNMSYFVGMEKNVVFRVHCFEEDFNDHPMIQLITGTALLKEGEEAENIFSCTFNSKGRRLCKETTIELQYKNENDELENDNVELRTTIAIKRAELLKLNKEEKKEVIPPFSFALFLFSVIVMGGLFGFFMTIGMALVSVLVTCIVNASLAWEILVEMPWFWLFIFSGASFGIIMGIISILVKRK